MAEAVRPGHNLAEAAIVSAFWRLNDVQREALIAGLATGEVAALTVAAAAGTSNVCNVTVQLKDGDGANLTRRELINFWLSDEAAGAGVTGTTASGTVTATTGVDIGVITAKKVLTVLTDATGKAVIAITDSAKTQFYCCASVAGKAPVVDRALTAKYG